MLTEVCFAVVLVLGLMFVIWLVKSMLLMPVPAGQNIRISIVMRAEGSCPELENTAKSVLWLIHSGVIEGKLIIADAGLDSESGKVARLLARDVSRIKVTTPEECGSFL